MGAFTAGGGGTSSKSNPCPSTLQRGTMHSLSTHWVPGFPSGAHPPLPAPIQPGAGSLRSPTVGNPSLPGYLRPAVPAAALAPVPCDEEAGFLSGEAPQQLQVRDKVQDIVVSSQLSPLCTRLHSHGPATPALCQPSANSQTLGMGTGSTGTPRCELDVRVPRSWGHQRQPQVTP